MPVGYTELATESTANSDIRTGITELVTALGFGVRIRQAILDKASQIGARYPNAQFARDVGEIERGKAYSAAVISEWIAERSEPSIATFRAMAKVTGKSVAWLMALDEEPAAPARPPESVPIVDRESDDVPDPRASARDRDGKRQTGS